MPKSTAMINNLVIDGYVASDVELQHTKNGKALTKFAIGKPLTNGETTTWQSFQVEAWERLAEVCAEKLGKGSKVLIVGMLRESSWESEGQKKSRVYITANQVEFIHLKELAEPDEQ